MKVYNRIFFLAFLLAVPFNSFSQVPTDNVYLTRYESGAHWTNNIKWKNVVNALLVKGLVRNDRQVDSLIIHRTIKKISSQGGGVLYFPAGVYYFNFNLRLENGVVIRGANPTSESVAKKAGFSPPTKFEFPKFHPVLTGAGTPHNVFKAIYGDTVGIKNAGLVNLDINRAVVNFFPGGYQSVITLQGSTYWCKNYHDNIIIFGLRQNNAVIPSPEIPNARQIETGHAWQRWPYPYIGNINVFVSNNCVIANCRLNDAVTDDFEQPDYVDQFYSRFTGKEACFSYTDHPGICLNYYKIVSSGQKGDASGIWGPYGLYYYTQREKGFESLDTLSEPSLFLGGKREIIDNFVLINQRHKHIVANPGANTIIKDNITANPDSVKALAYVNERGMQSLYNSSSPDVLKYFERKEWITEKNDTLRYRLMKPSYPPKEKKYPLVIFLHSEDLFGRDNQKQLAYFVPKFCTEENLRDFPCYVVAPQEVKLLGAWVDSDNETFNPALILTRQLIDKMIMQGDVDEKRIYVIGLSRGGTAAWKLAARYPDKFSAVVALDGLEYPFTDKDVDGLKSIPVWTAVPRSYGFFSLFIETRLNAIRLKRKGDNVVFNLQEGGDRQTMVNESYNDPKFFPWLFSKTK